MNGLTILAGIVVMTIAVTDVTGFQCYTGPGVDDPGAAVDCSFGTKACLKVHVVASGTESITRSCGIVVSGNECTSLSTSQGTATTCVCDTNLCNSANNNGANMLFGAVMAFAVMKLV